MARSHKKTRRNKRAGGKICNTEYLHDWTPETGSGIIYDSNDCSNFYKGHLTPDKQERLGGVIPVDDCNDILYWLGSKDSPTFYYCRNGSGNKGKCRARSLRGRGICNNNRDLQTKYYKRVLDENSTGRLTKDLVDELLREEQLKIDMKSIPTRIDMLRMPDVPKGGRTHRPKKTRRRSRKHRVKSRRRR